MPWTEIVDQYHGLFEAKGDLRLEVSLFNAFAQKDAKEHGLRMYRGLPRLYQADRPSNSKLKKYFSDLATLKRLAVEKSAFRIYDSFPLPEFSRVSFFTWVSNWDDYAAGCKAVETIEERFPELELSWIVLVPSRKRHLRIPKGCKTHLIVYEQKNTLGSGTAIMKEQLFDEEFVSFIATVDFSATAPTALLVLRKGTSPVFSQSAVHHLIPVQIKQTNSQEQASGCKPSGCSGQVCSDQDVITDCAYKEEYICYEKAKCERQENGQCGWTKTKELSACLSQFE